MAAEAELERLVVRLVGDGNSYMDMLKQAQESTTNAANAVEGITSRIYALGGGLRIFGERAAEAFASLLLIGRLKTAFHEFATAEQALLKLEAVVRANGRAVGDLIPKYQSFAAKVQGLTQLSDENVLDMLRTAETYGLTGEAALGAAKKAIALSGAVEGTSKSAAQYMRMAVALEQGNIRLAMMMGRMIPQLRGIKDETEFVAKANKLLAGGLAAVQAEAGSFSGRLGILKNSLSDLMEQFGEIVAKAISPVIDGIQRFVEFMTQLPTSVKESIVFMAALGAVIVGIAPALSAIAFLAGAIFNPIILGAAVAAGALTILVDQLGGFGPVWDAISNAAIACWDAITEAVSSFLEFFEPTIQAINSLGAAAWELVQEAALVAWEFITGVWSALRETMSQLWEGLGIDASAIWEAIRDTITSALLAAEYGLRNFDKVASFVWTSVKLGVVRLANQVIYFFTEVVPATLDWFAENWREIFTDIWNWTKTVFSNLISNIVELVKNIPGLIAGTTSLDEIWKPLTEGFKRASKELQVPERVMGDVEKKLQDEFNAMGDELGEGFEEFRRRKMEEFKKSAEMPKAPVLNAPKIEKEALDVGKKVDKLIGKDVDKKVKLKFDAAEFGSAEALSRIEEFFTMGTIGGGGGKEGGAAPGKLNASEAGSAEATGREEEVAQAIETADQNQANRDLAMITVLNGIKDKVGGGVQLAPAGIG